jgi:hypothetical protein
MKTKRYIVQFKSVYQPAVWLDEGNGYLYPEEANDRAKMLRNVNENVRVVERETTDIVLAEL